jgi:glycosyltransferase involved in cell wall biosynthesis
MIRTNDPRVSRIMAQKQGQAQVMNGRTYRAVPSASSFADRFPDGAWRGQRCFIVGGGPSLKGFDFNRLRGERVIAINKAFYDVPFADVMFAMDRPLLDLIMEGKLGEDYRAAFESFPGAKLWLDLSGYSYPAGVYSVPTAGATGWTKSIKDGLIHGNNSGYGALNLALCLGADPIYLLGYDCKRGDDGSKNYHSGYPSGSNPDAMNIFKREIEAGAKLEQAISHKVINLNPESALKCFEFGNVDDVLAKTPKSTGDRITAITPTGDRPLAFRLCREWMANQTRRPDQWLIIDDGKTPIEFDSTWFNSVMPGVAVGIRREPRRDDPLHTLDLNLKAALPHITGDKILIIEDDEYYAPGYVEEMARRLDQAEVVGICRSKYYHLPTGGYQQIGNVGHASLAQTGFRSSFLPVFGSLIQNGDNSKWPDDKLWRHVQATAGKASAIRAQLFVDDQTPLYVGMKGLPGRGGIGAGHKTSMYHATDKDRSQLKAWIPRDYQVYLDIVSECLTDRNADEYFRKRKDAQEVFLSVPSTFDDLLKSLERDGKRLNQHTPEWKAYLEFAAGYFKARGIARPLVVEIGILDGAQRRFYETLMGAEYIGIDINSKGPADIVGDSSAPETLAKLKHKIGGAAIDLLFIDGLHTYAGAKSDYEIYGPLVRHIIAIHDIHTPKIGPKDPVEVWRLWGDILAGNKTDTIITVQRHNPRRPDEFNGRPLGIGILVKDAPEALTPSLGTTPRAKAPQKCVERKGEPSQVPKPTVSVISRWHNEQFMAPFFLGHYAFADEIIIMLDKSTTDRSAEIIDLYPNARYEYFDHGGKLNDRLLADMMSDLAASLKTDWVIYADADELAFPEDGEDAREVLAKADGNLIETLFRWVYRHATEEDLDPSKPAAPQRRHGGPYTIVPNPSDKFMKPCIVKPEAGVRWGVGQHDYKKNPKVKVSSIKFSGAHWQMADVEEAVRRYNKNNDRLSPENVKSGWGVKNFTEAMIREECSKHLNDPIVI